MKLLTLSVTDDGGKPRFVIHPVGKKDSPVALCGVAEGSGAEQARLKAQFLSTAVPMYDMLEQLFREYGNLNPNFPISAGKQAELKSLCERAGQLVDRFKDLRF